MTTCLSVVWFGGLCLAVAWLVFVQFIGLTSTSLFILGSATGLIFSPIFPLSFGFYNQRLNVVPMLLALLLCGSALGAITLQKLAGNFDEIGYCVEFVMNIFRSRHGLLS